MDDTSSNTQEDSLSTNVAVSEPLGSTSHPLSPAGPTSADSAAKMPNSTSNHSIGQDVNQNITQSERTDGANASFKKRGSITFVITDHSDPCNQPRKNSDSDHSESSSNNDLKCPHHRKTSVCESIPEEKPGVTDSARLSQGSIVSGGILRLPPPSNRKSGRSMSECSDYHDYSLTSDGNYLINYCVN